jgi:hypothetical protein
MIAPVREQFIRAGFSFLAAAVTLSMAGEWTAWALEQRKHWKLGPAAFLLTMALFEANQVRLRGERLVGIASR